MHSSGRRPRKRRCAATRCGFRIVKPAADALLVTQARPVKRTPMNRERYDEWSGRSSSATRKPSPASSASFYWPCKPRKPSPPRTCPELRDCARQSTEIHVLPGNLKDARDTVFPYFWGTDSWASPLHLEKREGPGKLRVARWRPGLLLKNPNLCTDTYKSALDRTGSESRHCLGQPPLLPHQRSVGRVTMGGTVSNLMGPDRDREGLAPGHAARPPGREAGGIVSDAHITADGHSRAGWDSALRISTTFQLTARWR